MGVGDEAKGQERRRGSCADAADARQDGKRRSADQGSKQRSSERAERRCRGGGDDEGAMRLKGGRNKALAEATQKRPEGRSNAPAQLPRQAACLATHWSRVEWVWST